MDVPQFIELVRIFLYAFLAIFVVTAILTLLSLPGWIAIPSNYKSKLFAALLLQLVGSVLGFVGTGVTAFRHSISAPAISRDFVIRQQSSWDWQVASEGWTTEAAFSPDGDKRLSFVAKTKYKYQPIYSWKSIQPFELAADGSVTFDVKQTIVGRVKDIVGPLAADPGEYDVRITLKPTLAYRGMWHTTKGPGITNPVFGGIDCMLGKDTY